MSKRPNYSGAKTIDGASVKVLDAAVLASGYEHIYVVNTDETNPCVLMFGDEEVFYIPAGFVGGLPKLVCRRQINAKKVAGDVISLYVTAW
jgi:hypothetical protein